jgi:hypothetical protein
MSARRLGDDAPMTFTPANPLEQVLLEVTESGEHGRFLATLATHPVFLPAPGGDGGERERPLEGDEALELPVFEHDGTRFVAAFTSLEQLDRSASGAPPFRRATGEELAAIWPEGHGLAVNPGGDLGVAIAEEDVQALAAAAALGGADLTVGAPTPEPEPLWVALRSWAAREPAVAAAHRALVLVHEPGEEPALVVGLDLELEEGADPGPLLRAGAEALGGVAAFTLLDPTGADPISQWWLERDAPVYTRGA